MIRTKQTSRPVLKKPEDQTAGFLNSMYLAGRPAAVKDYKTPIKGGRTGSR